MTASTPVQIHEFSTGIRPERTSDSWLSRGFTGQYMNATIEPIPYAVQRSIANKEFTVAEGASSSEPAIIGRVVLGSGESDWSVVAVVTRGRDEKGRPLSVYRYFLCEGADSLPKILAWIDSQRQIGRMPIFDPFDSKIVGQPNEWRGFNQLPVPIRDELQPLLRDTAPVIIPFGEPCTALIINEMATQKAKGQPISWAYKVEALEQPGRFQVIYPASERAYDLLQRTKISTPQITGGFIVADEQAIKSAIKGLISSSRVKPEHVQAIATALGTDIPEKYWQEIFDGQGAANALRQGIYSPQMVRLLTLRAIVMPETLPAYLSWMQNRGKQDDNYTVSDEFQIEIKNCFKQIPGQADNLRISLIRGVKLIIARLIDQPELLDAVVSLLKTPNGLWRKFYFEGIIPDIDNDLILMSRSSKGHQNLPFKMTDNLQWKKILGDLQNFQSPQEKYQPLAQLFGQLGNFPKISAFFYQVGYGVVPKDIFTELPPTRDRWRSNVYGLRIKRKITIVESLGYALIKEIRIGDIPMPLLFALIVLLIFTGLGFGGGLLVGSRLPHEQKKPASYTVDRTSDEAQNSSGTNPIPDPQGLQGNNSGPGIIGPERNVQTSTNSDRSISYKSLQKLIDYFVNEAGKKQTDVEKKLLEILELAGNDSINTINETELEQAIMKYQTMQIKKQKFQAKADGIINFPVNDEKLESESTFYLLKCDLAEKFDYNLRPKPRICNKS